ncbi:serine protease [Synechococcus sp. AH-601-C19]|nr:serine protease [Synechococcus sp. AH-601-C19]
MIKNLSTMNKLAVGSLVALLAVGATALRSSANVNRKLFFTTESFSSLNKTAQQGLNDLEKGHTGMQQCVMDLVSTGDQAEYVKCLSSKAQNNWGSAIQSRPELISLCMDAGYKTCLTMRISAAMVSLNLPVSGSGVIIGNKGNTYLVATSKHVLDNLAKNEIGEVIWQNNVVGTFKLRDTWQSSKYDIAIARFNSTTSIPVAPLASTDLNTLNEKINVAGFPLASDLNQSNMPGIRFSNGSISSSSPLEAATDGYSIGYTAPTTAGMSGGGVFVSADCKSSGQMSYASPIPLLVAIHGRAESTEAKGATGFNYAVPVSALRDYPNLNSYLDIKNQKANFGCPNGYSEKIVEWFN